MRFIVISGVLILASGCLQVDASVPKVCFLESGISMRAISNVMEEAQRRVEDFTENGGELPSSFAPSVDTETTYTRDELQEIPATFDDMGLDTSVFLDFVEVRAVRGLTSFAGFERIALTIAPIDPTPGLPSFELAACEAASGCDTSDDTVTLRGDARDLFPYLREGSLAFTLSVEGGAPLDVWVFDVDTCLNAQATLTQSL